MRQVTERSGTNHRLNTWKDRCFVQIDKMFSRVILSQFLNELRHSSNLKSMPLECGIPKAADLPEQYMAIGIDAP